MSLFSTIALAMGTAWVSGINLYASVATLGLLGRFTNLHLPGELAVLTNWWIIGIAATLYLIEFIADKIPVFDSTWDVIHTFIRVPAGAVLAAAAFGDFDKRVQVVAFMLGGGLALSSHGTKAVTRAVINTSPEPVTNSVASLGEDVVAVTSIFLAAFYPIVLIIVVVIGLIISMIVLPRTIRYIQTLLGKNRGKGRNRLISNLIENNTWRPPHFLASTHFLPSFSLFFYLIKPFPCFILCSQKGFLIKLMAALGDGDTIHTDIPNHSLHIEITDKEIKKRLAR